MSELARSDEEYTRPSPLGADLRVTAYAERGGDVLGVWDFTRLPCAEAVQRELAASFAELVDVGGPWRREATMTGGFNGVQHFVRWFDERGQTIRSLEALTPVQWAEYATALPGSVSKGRLLSTKTVLRGAPSLRPETLARIDRTSKRYEAVPQEGLTVEEVRRLKRVAHEQLDAACERIQQGWALLDAYRQGGVPQGSAEHDLGRLLDYADRHHDLPRYESAGRNITKWAQRALGSARTSDALAYLFFDFKAASAAIALLVAYEGWNPSVATGLLRTDVTRADSGDEDQVVFSVKTRKYRRGATLAHDTSTLVETSRKSSAAVLRQVLEVTDRTRQSLAAYGEPTDALIPFARHATGRTKGTSALTTFDVSKRQIYNGMEALSADLGLRDEDGNPRSFTLMDIRRGVVTTRPQGHSEGINNSAYRLNNATVRRESLPIIEDGLRRALAYAEPVVLPNPTTRDQAEATLGAEVLAQAEGGALDTPTASCRNVAESPFNDGRMCNVSFLLCLACSNAIVLRRHLPRLVYLHDQINLLRHNLADSPEWQGWAEHWARLSDLLDRHFTPEERAVARTALDDHDRELIDMTMARRYDA